MNMMFDNSPPAQPSVGAQVRSHLPVLAVVGGAFALFISLHVAAFGIAVAAGLHVVIGGAAMLGTRWANRKRPGESGHDRAHDGVEKGAQ